MVVEQKNNNNYNNNISNNNMMVVLVLSTRILVIYVKLTYKACVEKSRRRVNRLGECSPDIQTLAAFSCKCPAFLIRLIYHDRRGQHASLVHLFIQHSICTVARDFHCSDYLNSLNSGCAPYFNRLTRWAIWRVSGRGCIN